MYKQAESQIKYEINVLDQLKVIFDEKQRYVRDANNDRVRPRAIANKTTHSSFPLFNCLLCLRCLRS